MHLSNALVALLCAAMLSVGLAIGLGSGGEAAAAGNADSRALKDIKTELVKVNKALGTPTSLSGQDVTDLLYDICNNTKDSVVGC